MEEQAIRQAWVRPALAGAWLAALSAVVFLAPLGWLLREWGDNPYYEHGPFVPLIALGLAAFALPRLRERGLPRETGVAGPALVAAGLALRLAGALGGSEFLGAVGLVALIAGFTAWWLGLAGLRTLAFPIAYLLIALPLPFMDDVGFYFQRLSTLATAGAVRLLGVPATYQGAEVSLPAAQFFVGVQCSGLYSTVSLTMLGLLFLRLLDLDGWLRQALLVAAIPLVAIVSNVFRLSSLLVIAHRQSAEVAMAYYHALGEFAFWLLAMALLFLIGKGLEWTCCRQPRPA